MEITTDAGLVMVGGWGGGRSVGKFKLINYFTPSEKSNPRINKTCSSLATTN